MIILLGLFELFTLGVKAEALRANIVQNRRFRSNGGRLTISGRKGRPPLTILLRKVVFRMV